VLIRQLEYLATLERERHFGRAARACGVAQPTLSAGIRRLEESLGAPLVRRGQRFEGFTPEGERALRWARRILADADGLTHDLSAVRGGLEGLLRLGVIPTALPAVAHVTSRFCELHPRMRVAVLSMSSREIERQLEAYEIDAGLTYLDNEPLGAVRSVALYTERYLLLTPADGPFAGRATVRWGDAATVPLCLLTPDMQNRRIVDSVFASVGADSVPTVETNSLSTLFAHVQRGWSSVISHAWLALYDPPRTMRALPLVAPDVEHAIGLVSTETELEEAVVGALFELARSLDVDRALASDRAAVAMEVRTDG